MSDAQLSDPDVLRGFISLLISFNSDLDQRCRNLSGHWADLQNTWRDPQCARFAQDWEVTVQTIRAYLDDSSSYVDHLRAKLRQVEGYAG